MLRCPHKVLNFVLGAIFIEEPGSAKVSHTLVSSNVASVAMEAFMPPPCWVHAIMARPLSHQVLPQPAEDAELSWSPDS